MKKEDENQRRRRKESFFFFWFYEVLTFFRFSELDTGISRIVSLVPGKKTRTKDAKERKYFFGGVFTRFDFFLVFGTRCGYFREFSRLVPNEEEKMGTKTQKKGKIRKDTPACSLGLGILE